MTDPRGGAELRAQEARHRGSLASEGDGPSLNRHCRRSASDPHSPLEEGGACDLARHAKTDPGSRPANNSSGSSVKPERSRRLSRGQTSAEDGNSADAPSSGGGLSKEEKRARVIRLRTRKHCRVNP